MRRIAYYLLIKPLSMLPLPVLYFITWPLYFLMAHLIDYRGKVIVKNLRNSFPDKSEQEIKTIKRKFHRHLFDYFIESLTLLSMSEKEGLKRLKVTNPELLDKFYAEGRHVAMLMGHYNNWEMIGFLNIILKHRFVAIFANLKNKFANEVIKKSRIKGDAIMVPRKEVNSFMRTYKERPFIMFFGSDQSPNMKSRLHWSVFLNQPSAFATGAERYAKLMNMGVVFAHLAKVKRGHYELTFEMISEEPKETKGGEIMEAYVRILERQIQKAPQFWLWSHKRWKRKAEDFLSQEELAELRAEHR